VYSSRCSVTRRTALALVSPSYFDGMMSNLPRRRVCIKPGAIQPGYRVLDGIRAALDFDSLGLTMDTRIGIWGYSGGGLASSWAGEMASKYAAELDIVGVALGSPVGDPASTFLRLNGTAFSGLPALVLAGLRRVYPELDWVLGRHSSEAGLRLMKSIESMSTLTAVRKFARYDLSDFIDVPLADLLAEREVVRVFDEIQVGRVPLNVPVFVIQSVRDQIISVDDVDGQVDRYRAAGVNVTYRRDKLSEHLSLHVLSTPVALNWLADRFADEPLALGSTKTVWSTGLAPSVLPALLALGWDAWRAALGRPIRP
jgi:hypothetical protein